VEVTPAWVPSTVQAGQFASVTLSVAGAEVTVVDDLLDVVDADVTVALVEAAGVAGTGVVVGTEWAVGRLTAAVPVVVGEPGVECAALLDLAGAPVCGAGVDDSGASCGTVTTTMAPARAATGDGDALTAVEEAVADAEVSTVHAASPRPTNAVMTVLSAVFRRGRRTGNTDMVRSYTTDTCDPGNRYPMAACGVRHRSVTSQPLESPAFQSRPLGPRRTPTTRCS
jgi:hypothetical protein